MYTLLVIQRPEAKQQVVASLGGRNRSAITLASVQNFTISVLGSDVNFYCQYSRTLLALSDIFQTFTVK